MCNAPNKIRLHWPMSQYLSKKHTYIVRGLFQRSKSPLWFKDSQNTTHTTRTYISHIHGAFIPWPYKISLHCDSSMSWTHACYLSQPYSSLIHSYRRIGLCEPPIPVLPSISCKSARHTRRVETKRDAARWGLGTIDPDSRGQGT